MKVLIETITNRRGYKFFENREEMDAYLGRHCGTIANYEVLQEDDAASTNDILRGLAEECEVLENKLFYICISFSLYCYIKFQVSSPHKNIYQEKLADFDLEKKDI